MERKDLRIFLHAINKAKKQLMDDLVASKNNLITDTRFLDFVNTVIYEILNSYPPLFKCNLNNPSTEGDNSYEKETFT